MVKKKKPLWEDNEWTFDKIKKVEEEIGKIARKKLKLKTYPIQIEIISSDQMLSAYSSTGMPVLYGHWSYGKQYVNQQKQYKRGQMGLAYEIVINSNPCIGYLMEENTMTMQALVIAHACYGHNAFFKNNYLFKQWTDADSIVDYLIFAKKYIRECEEKYGFDQVEEMIDSCHVLMNYGVDRYKKPKKLSIKKEEERQARREIIRQEQVNDIWKSLPDKKPSKKKPKDVLPEPQENLLYFLEKNSPILEPWQSEIVRIIRKISQYFYPQRQTQVMNEGFATFVHHFIMNDLHQTGLMTDGAFMEFLSSHTNVISQPQWDSKFFNGINVYTLGFNMMRDIKRICENPTDEDKRWFPDIVGSNWLETIKFAVKNYKDESFILQFLSPSLIREMKLFGICDNKNNTYNYLVNSIHDEYGYKFIREELSKRYNLSFIDPNIQITKVDKDGDRTLYLTHYIHDEIPLGKSTMEVLKHVHKLWGYDVILESINNEGKIIKTYKCGTNN